jgi:hypothetical protein
MRALDFTISHPMPAHDAEFQPDLRHPGCGFVTRLVIKHMEKITSQNLGTKTRRELGTTQVKKKKI